MGKHARTIEGWDIEDSEESLELALDEGFDEDSFDLALQEERLRLGIVMNPASTKTSIHGAPHQIDARIQHSREANPINENPTTADRFSYTDDESGERIYDESRKPVHDAVGESMLRMDGTGKPCANCPKHTTPTGRAPQAFFTAGADAQTVNDHPDRPEKAVVLDPRLIAAELPEADEGEEATIEEAEDIAAHLAVQIQTQGVDVIVVGDDAPSEEHIKQYMDAGYSYPQTAQ